MVRFRALRGAALAVVAILVAAACGTSPTAPPQQPPQQPPAAPVQPAFAVQSTTPANNTTEVPLAGGTRVVPGVGPV
ncbi:MAG: hypothetical protein QN208_11685, partial [Armatimonadota bacterium]|nr:hypothetical protein [Armatimonadota bacterium]